MKRSNLIVNLMRKAGPSATCLFLLLLERAESGSPDWPPVAVLQEQMGLSRRSIYGLMSRLERAKFLKRIARRRKTVSYALLEVTEMPVRVSDGAAEKSCTGQTTK